MNLDEKLTEMARDVQRQEARHLIEILGAPIFIRLMVERGLNPLGIERWQDDIDLQTFAGDSIRFEQRVAFMQTRPYPRRLV